MIDRIIDQLPDSPPTLTGDDADRFLAQMEEVSRRTRCEATKNPNADGGDGVSIERAAD